MPPGDYDTLPWQQEAGPCVFSPFHEDSKYFPADKRWMVNSRVSTLDAMVAQFREAGITVEIDPQSYPNGRFARLYEPESNANRNRAQANGSENRLRPNPCAAVGPLRCFFVALKWAYWWTKPRKRWQGLES